MKLFLLTVIDANEYQGGKDALEELISNGVDTTSLTQYVKIDNKNVVVNDIEIPQEFINEGGIVQGFTLDTPGTREMTFSYKNGTSQGGRHSARGQDKRA